MASRPSPASRFSPEERIGLGVALAAHVALFGWLALEPPRRDLVPPPDRMTVSFAEEVALQSTAPEPMVEAAPEVAPTRGEAAPEPQPEPLPVARPEPRPQPVPRVIPTPQPRLVPRPVPTPVPKRVPPKAAPTAKPTAKPVAKPAPKSVAKPVAKPSAATKPATRTAAVNSRARPDAPKGASRVGNDFLKGLPGGQAAGAATTPPAAKAGPQVAASLAQAIGRQLKPRWVAPQGAEADQLVTIVRFSLNRDGSLAGRPQIVSQSGVTEANSAQKGRHAEQAIRAVQLAAPFDLPDQYYDSWKTVTSRFDRKLSQ